MAWRFSLQRLLAGVLAAAVLFAMVHYAVRSYSRRQRDRTTKRFRQASLVLHNYEDVIGHIPAATQRVVGSNASSWRYVMWSYLERSADGDRQIWSEPWDGPGNLAIWKGSNFPFFCYPGHGDDTFVLAVTGPGTAFGDGTEPPLTFADMDGDTIVLIESRDSGLKWPQPGDIDYREIGRLYESGSAKGPSSIHAGGFHVAFADGEAWFLSTEVPFETLQPFLTIDGARSRDRDQDLLKFRR